MCGGIVMAINSRVKLGEQNLFYSNLLYNLGRLLSYCCLGGFFGSIGKLFELSLEIKNIFMICIGVIIALIALLMLFAPKILAVFEPSFHKSKIFRALFTFFYRDLSYWNLFFLGMLNGFLPCGIVYYFALIALASGGFLQGVSVMAIFGLCTLIPMLPFGLFSNFVLHKRWLSFIGLLLMFLFGLYTICKGLKGL